MIYTAHFNNCDMLTAKLINYGEELAYFIFVLTTSFVHVQLSN